MGGRFCHPDRCCRADEGSTHLGQETPRYSNGLAVEKYKGDKHGQPCSEIAADHCENGCNRLCTGDSGLAAFEDPLLAKGPVQTGLLDVNADGGVNFEDLKQSLWLSTNMVEKEISDQSIPDMSEKHFQLMQLKFQQEVREEAVEEAIAEGYWDPEVEEQRSGARRASGRSSRPCCHYVPGFHMSTLEDPLRVQGPIRTGLLDVNADGEMTFQDLNDALWLSYPVDNPEVPDVSRKRFAELQQLNANMLDPREAKERGPALIGADALGKALDQHLERKVPNVYERRAWRSRPSLPPPIVPPLPLSLLSSAPDGVPAQLPKK